MKSIVLIASILRIILITAILSFAIYANAHSMVATTREADANKSAMLARGE